MSAGLGLNKYGEIIKFNVVKIDIPTPKYCIHTKPIQLKTKVCIGCGVCETNLQRKGVFKMELKKFTDELGIKDQVTIEGLESLSYQLEEDRTSREEQQKEQGKNNITASLIGKIDELRKILKPLPQALSLFEDILSSLQTQEPVEE